MKIICRLSLTACVCFWLVGSAVGQDYYGGYYPSQGQDYGAYGPSGDGQAYPNYGYGQGASSGYDSPYGYTEPSSPQGYQAPYGYDQYPGIPGYGRYDETPYGAGSYNLPSVSPQGNQPTLRSRLTPPINRAGRPEVRESTRVTPSRNQVRSVQQPTAVPLSRDTEAGALYSNEIYWDNTESEKQESYEPPSQTRPAQSVNQGNSVPRSNEAARQVKPFTNSKNQPRVQRTRPNVVRQETKSASTTPSPPPASSFKWGKEQDDTSQQATESRQSFKWGMQGKPSMVGSEPGRSDSSQGLSQVSSQGGQQDATSSLDSNSKRFQWGKAQ